MKILDIDRRYFAVSLQVFNDQYIKRSFLDQGIEFGQVAGGNYPEITMVYGFHMERSGMDDGLK